jgi:hypothetical protein
MGLVCSGASARLSANGLREMTVNFSRDELVALLVKAGELEVIGGDQSEN